MNVFNIFRAKPKIDVPRNYGEKTVIHVHILGFKKINYSMGYSSEKHWVVNFKVNDSDRVYQSRTGNDSYTASYNNKSPIIKYLEKIDMDTAIRRTLSMNVLPPGLMLDDVDIVYK